MGSLFRLLVPAGLGLCVIAIIDCLSSEKRTVRALPKAVWIVVILLFPLVGPVCWLVAGRPQRG